MQDALVVIRKPPWSRIEILAGRELDMLGGAAQLGIDVPAMERPVPPARPVVVFQHLDLVAGVAQFQCRYHAGYARAEDQDRGAGTGIAEFGWAGIARLLRETQPRHGVVHGGRTRHSANHSQQGTAADRLGFCLAHESPRMSRWAILSCLHRQTLSRYLA